MNDEAISTGHAYCLAQIAQLAQVALYCCARAPDHDARCMQHFQLAAPCQLLCATSSRCNFDSNNNSDTIILICSTQNSSIIARASAANSTTCLCGGMNVLLMSAGFKNIQSCMLSQPCSTVVPRHCHVSIQGGSTLTHVLLQNCHPTHCSPCKQLLQLLLLIETIY